MHKIGVVGDKDSILAFRVLGVDVYPAVGKEEARKIIDKLASDKYGIIFVTEQIAQLVEETIERYNRDLIPAIILIPNNQGSLGTGIQKINDYVEKAIGSNIF
ncbi:V-type ATP synthase subunit F [Pseudoleptotrichia goodfellowii]|uniref:V-type ATP synthase subunit F n=1 Tax=Pseudoleptotrichia goodfellowii F0264 TaxID=596323 RepID=D0GLF3_9FUSO|nr:V-type ATP synthase subunit F [Pseudoleptotrichia goodfellowii]EEY35054.1 ATP synthase, subunit F [Pseudoleptotrichia goodfellowii F0264]